MRESVGNTWVFALVLTFTLIFAGFLVLALAYSKAFKLKNEMTSMIEKYEGVTYKSSKNPNPSLTIINNYLKNNNYTARNYCDTEGYKETYGLESIDDEKLVKIDSDETRNTKYLYCISYKVDERSCNFIFRVTVFYDFNLPFLGKLRKYSISGITNEMPLAYFGDKRLENNCYEKK